MISCLSEVLTEPGGPAPQEIADPWEDELPPDDPHESGVGTNADWAAWEATKQSRPNDHIPSPLDIQTLCHFIQIFIWDKDDEERARRRIPGQKGAPALESWLPPGAEKFAIKQLPEKRKLQQSHTAA